MTDSSRPTVIVGNWKMYKTVEESLTFLRELAPLIANASNRVYLAVPFTAIKPMAEEAKKISQIVIGAQNMSDVSEGAFTGEISAFMLKDVGAQFVILGHSERRKIFHEDNAFINKKVKKALEEKIQPILCIGETLEERESKKTEDVLKSQILECLLDVSADQLDGLLLAYEPVWAIGTSLPATPEIAEEVHQLCRRVVSEKWGADVAEKIVILYGGSVKPNNAGVLLSQADIDGLLVGGASLSSTSFSQIVNALTS